MAVALSMVVSVAWAAGMLPAQEAAQMLRADYPQIQLYQQGDRVTRVYGQPMTTGEGPEESAELFIISHAEVFGVQPDELVLTGFEHAQDFIQPVMFDRDLGEYKFYLLRYTQQRAGVPVFRSDFRLLVRNEEGYPLVWAGADVRDLGNFVPTNAAPVSGAVLNAAAEAAVAAEAGRTNLVGEPLASAAPGFVTFSTPTPAIWAGLDTNPLPPVDAVTYIADNYGNPSATRPEKWLFVADPATGAILYKESMILFTDVSGRVQGMATEGAAADYCNDEVATPIPFARVNIGTTVAYTDSLGYYTVPNGGSSAVTVQTQLWGTWFRVNNSAGSAVVLSQSVTPPGPADFMHNSANTDELIRAQVNGYVEANQIRNLVLTHNPDYPGMSQNEFPVYVNRTDVYCPGNAWYDYSSINFCRSGSGYPNTAWQSVIDHEYGHHLVSMAGSGQDQYGEGMGDVMSVLTSDDPRLGLGFTGSCTTGLRNANNTMQYPCSGEAHDCAGLLSGCVWSLRNQLVLTEPFDYRTILGDLAINAMLLHTGSQTTPQITIDYLTIDDDNGYIGDGTPHYAEIDAGFGAHNMPAPELDLLRFEFPDDVPSMIPPQQTDTVRVNVIGIAGTPQAGTGRIFTRINSGSFTNTLMASVGTNQYEGTLPAADCYQRVDFYFTAQTTGGQTVYNPAGAPANYYSALVATGQTLALTDDFDTNLGWTVQNVSLTDGPWERGIPVNCQRGDPPADFNATGAGYCYLTDNANQSDCNTDVDGGYTYLISPTFDLSAGEAEIHYALWYTNDFGADPDNDLFKVYISNNNGTNWTLVRQFGPASSAGWNEYSFIAGTYVTLTATMKVRFEASDLNSGSVVEAGIDDFWVRQYFCDIINCPGDLDGDMDVDIADLAQLLSAYGTTSGAAYEDGDLDGDGDVDLTDLAALLGVYGVTCQ